MIDWEVRSRGTWQMQAEGRWRDENRAGSRGLERMSGQGCRYTYREAACGRAFSLLNGEPGAHLPSSQHKTSKTNPDASWKFEAATHEQGNKLQGLSGVGADGGTTPCPLPEAGKLARALHLPQPSGEEKPGRLPPRLYSAPTRRAPPLALTCGQEAMSSQK